MDKINFVAPSIECKDKIAAFKTEFIQCGSSMDGCGPLRRFDDIEAWIDWINRARHKETAPENYCRCDTFMVERELDKKIIGMIQMRYDITDYMVQYCGHVGYCVAPSEREKGYATQMLSMLLQRCKEQGIMNILILCLEENEASRRVIKKNGGIYENTVVEPNEGVRLQRYWIHLRK